MTVRDETAETPRETGTRSREAYLKQYVDRPNGEPARLAARSRSQACCSGYRRLQ